MNSKAKIVIVIVAIALTAGIAYYLYKNKAVVSAKLAGIKRSINTVLPIFGSDTTTTPGDAGNQESDQQQYQEDLSKAGDWGNASADRFNNDGYRPSNPNIGDSYYWGVYTTARGNKYYIWQTYRGENNWTYWANTYPAQVQVMNSGAYALNYPILCQWLEAQNPQRVGD